MGSKIAGFITLDIDKVDNVDRDDVLRMMKEDIDYINVRCDNIELCAYMIKDIISPGNNPGHDLIVEVYHDDIVDRDDVLMDVYNRLDRLEIDDGDGCIASTRLAMSYKILSDRFRSP